MVFSCSSGGGIGGVGSGGDGGSGGGDGCVSTVGALKISAPWLATHRWGTFRKVKAKSSVTGMNNPRSSVWGFAPSTSTLGL